MRIITVDKINKKINSNLDKFISSCDKGYYDTVTDIANNLEKEHLKSPIVLLSGPSGSGKTTTALAIESILDARGIETHTVSIDNYFKPLTEKDIENLKDGTLDFESPERVDKQFLNNQLRQMINGEAVELPKFSFSENKRKNSGRVIERKPNEIIIVEGIHALNPDVIEIESRFTKGIYVSVRTRVKSGEILLHPALIRLVRRMIRDKSFRGRALSETLEKFESVELGEEKFILPFKQRADFEVDTFFEYELSVYKNLLSKDLTALSKDKRIETILDVFEKLNTIPKSKISKESLIREFIGDGAYKY